MNYIEKALIATLIDYAEAGLDEPGLHEIKSDSILDSDFFFKEATSNSSPNALYIKNSANSPVTKKVPHNELSFGEEKLQSNSISDAIECAKKAMDIEALEQSIRTFAGFHALKGSSGMVFATGNSNSKVMVISEPPGRVEELQSKPYTGHSEELFNKIFAALGLSLDGEKESGLYVLPSLPFRLVRSLDIKISDLDLIKPFLERHIKMFSPKFLVLIGKIPGTILGVSNQFLGAEENGYIGCYDGTPTIEIEGINSMIKSPEKKRRTWNNLKLLKGLMNKEIQ